MFYLVSFLTMLISLLVYMMDPAPSDERHELDVRAAEAYIVSFVNQHQAARDFLYQWLGRINPAEENVESFPSGGEPIKAISVPAAMEDYFPLDNTFTFERAVNNNENNKSYLDFESINSENRKGEYLSALMCLDSDGDLASCYRYYCESGSEAVASCPVGQEPKSVVFAPDAVPYVLTYSDNTGKDPSWWETQGRTRPLRYELWRKALNNRTNSTTNCGVISDAQSFGSPSAGGSDSRAFVKNGRRIVWKQNPDSGDNGTRYCLNNGYGCVRLLPSGIQTYLEAVVSETGQSLSGILFCYSPVHDPYDVIVKPTYHFDGYDNTAKGALASSSGSNTEWHQVGGSATISGVQRGGGSQGFSTHFMVGQNNPSELPFKYGKATQDFTLNMVFDLKGGAGSGWLIGQLGSGSALEGNYGLYYYGNGEFQFYSNYCADTMMVCPGFKFFDLNEDRTDASKARPLVEKPHALTIVRHQSKISLYLDAHLVYPEPLAVQDDTGSNTNVHFGGVSVGIADIRYYNRALNAVEIRRNFKVDSKRYGVQDRKIDIAAQRGGTE